MHLGCRLGWKLEEPHDLNWGDSAPYFCPIVFLGPLRAWAQPRHGIGREIEGTEAHKCFLKPLPAAHPVDTQAGPL